MAKFFGECLTGTDLNPSVPAAVLFFKLAINPASSYGVVGLCTIEFFKDAVASMT